MKKLLKRISDIKNAIRVLEIMDKAGCDIKEMQDGCYKITTKWYVTEQEAKDLQTICLFKEHYAKRNKIWYKLFFRNIREGFRFL